ncbi:MAG: exodeoxyribonuclease VII large subunit [Acidimicrobiales bacterium]
MVLGPAELTVEGHPDALSIADLYDEVEVAIARSFPRSRQLWVRGEIQHVADQHGRTGHCYLDLVDPDTARERQAPVLRVKCWRSTWGSLRATLAREGVELQPGMVVFIRGTLDFYRAKAEVGFILAELDVTALLGRLAAARAALLRTLAQEGLLERNRALTVPPVPLRVGLVASPGTEGCRDFLGQLTGSGFSFAVTVAPTTVQGHEAPAAVAAALRVLGHAVPPFDLLVIVRGGGSKADLAAFDSEPVARAVAASPVPVWTGIGHTGDESVADLVANRSCITPTECGREVALRVAAWWDGSVAATAALVVRRAEEVLGRAEHGHRTTRSRLTGTARHLVDRQFEHLAERSGFVARCAPRAVDDARSAVTLRAVRLGPLAEGRVYRESDRLDAWRRLLAAYDVERQLERGYTLTTDGGGRTVRSAALPPGTPIVTRFADGSARSVVDSFELVPTGAAQPEKGAGGRPGKSAGARPGKSAGKGGR